MALHVEPWILPPVPDLARLAMEVADRLDVAELRAWPEARQGGIGFGALPPFLSWHGRRDDAHHLVLVQPREVGALVPGARIQPLPPTWLSDLDLESLARPLAHHPAWEGTASIHVVRLVQGEPSPVVEVRSWGTEDPDLVRAVLDHLSSLRQWRFTD